jgi:protein-tyrosine kinase
MREVDDALARAYAQRAQGDLPQGVPPAPHLRARTLHSAPELETASENSVELQWPPLVLSLERDWGVRFERMAQLLLAARQKQGLKVILFTSCHRAEGRTTLILTLARALSRQPIRT